MKPHHLFSICATLGALALPSLSQAHFLWIAVDAKSHEVKVAFQEVPGQDPLPLGEKVKDIQAWGTHGKKIDFTLDSNWLKGTAAGDCVAASLDYGVIDRRDSGRGVFWLKYYAKGASTIPASQEKFRMPMELSAKTDKSGRPVITVINNGKAAAGADIVIEDATGKSTFVGKTELDGTATLPTTEGAIEVRALVTENTKGTHDGKAYDLIRSYSTLTVEVGKPKLLTRQLRDAFGDNHDVVSHTAFITTAMAGSLTKTQLEDHLQQRAFIHQAIDDVLSHAQERPLPYDVPQKEVITLLRSDLVGMGSSWPDKSKSWPLTQAMVASIRKSAKNGPYYALGVFHVYYGGITHGGRDIGNLIENELKTHLTYYEKSDGYDPYAKTVDMITDPKAQEEMIRGGVDAYKYIIAINNSDSFKSASK